MITGSINSSNFLAFRDDVLDDILSALMRDDLEFDTAEAYYGLEDDVRYVAANFKFNNMFYHATIVDVPAGYEVSVSALFFDGTPVKTVEGYPADICEGIHSAIMDAVKDLDM